MSKKGLYFLSERDRETEKQRDKETERQRNRETEKKREI
jgi:hypothetical protein